METLLLAKLASVEDRFQEIEDLMAKPDVVSDYEQVQVLAKERASIEDIVDMYRKYRRFIKEQKDLQAILEEGSEPDIAVLARDELTALNAELEKLEKALHIAIVPRDTNDDKNVIVEIREGVGGQEAGLFAADLYRMYTRYALLKNWEVELLDSSPSEKGGFKEVVFGVRGKGAFSRLKFERGGHRVQRVPVTETAGRIHTSTATVAVLPEADEVEVDVDPDDLRIDIFHAGGHGGQNVNKVASAVRIVHIPTGTVAVCQDERSQYKNRQRAMSVLRARIHEAKQRKQESEIVEARRSQVGSGERAEKIRTYNFPQDRVTDHRIGTSFHGIQQALDGSIDHIVEALAAMEQAELLEKFLDYGSPGP
jgi:peptide chain release factor 1